MKVIILTLSMLLSATIMMAGNRPLAEMQAIAASKLNALAAERGQRKAPAKATELRCVADKEAYAVFSSDNTNGFVIVAKSTKVDPLIGYSSEPFETENMPANMQWYLEEVSHNIQAIEAGETHLSRAATYTAVKNFVTTKWDQSVAPYNLLTPNNYPAGCVATALAQCLNYCQYPPSAEFDASYSVTTGDKRESYNAHVSTTYTWPYSNTYKGKNPEDNIAQLLLDCGYATYMNYASEGSGSTIAYAGIALTQIFGYPEACVKYYNKSHYDKRLDEWKQIIYDELALRSPVIYGAHSVEYGGHAFVLSGVDNNGLIYVNWGWGGSNNGYFNIDALVVKSMLFASNHRMITGIRVTPLDTDQVAPRIWLNSEEPFTLRWGRERDENRKFHNTLYIDMPDGFMNLSPCTFEGVFGLFAQDLTDGTTWVIAEDLQDPDTIHAGYGYYPSGSDFYYYYFVDGDNGLKEGHTYRISFGSKDNREGTWHSVICDELGEIGYDITYTGTASTCTVSESPTPVPVVTDVTGINDIIATDRTDQNWYDLHGRRLAAPQKGINIINGKKIFVK